MIPRYHPVLSVPVVTIRGMAGDQETVTAAATVAAGGELVPRTGARPLGPRVIAAELLARTPQLAERGSRLVTFKRYERYGTSLDRHGTPLGPGTRRDLPHLGAAECAMYHTLTDPAWEGYRRIEQERIPLKDALAALATTSAALPV